MNHFHLQHGCGAEPGVVLPATLLWPLQTEHRGLDATVPAPPWPVPVRTHQHSLTSSFLLSQDQTGCRPKVQNVFIYFFISWLLVKKDQDDRSLENARACRCLCQLIFVQTAAAALYSTVYVKGKLEIFVLRDKKKTTLEGLNCNWSFVLFL